MTGPANGPDRQCPAGRRGRTYAGTRIPIPPTSGGSLVRRLNALIKTIGRVTFSLSPSHSLSHSGRGQPDLTARRRLCRFEPIREHQHQRVRRTPIVPPICRHTHAVQQRPQLPIVNGHASRVADGAGHVVRGESGRVGIDAPLMQYLDYALHHRTLESCQIAGFSD